MKTRRLSEITLAVLPFQVLSDQDVINPNAFGFYASVGRHFAGSARKKVHKIRRAG